MHVENRVTRAHMLAQEWLEDVGSEITIESEREISTQAYGPSANDFKAHAVAYMKSHHPELASLDEGDWDFDVSCEGSDGWFIFKTNDQVSPMGNLTIKRLNGLVKKGLLISKPNDKFQLSEDGLTLFLKNRGW